MLTFVVSWWVVGVTGFVFWWTKEHNLKLEDLIVSFGVGFLGPFCWVCGYFIHGRPKGSMSRVIIIKKRDNG